MKATLAPAASDRDRTLLLAMRESFLAEVRYHFGVDRGEDGAWVVPDGLRVDQPGLESLLVVVDGQPAGFVDFVPPRDGAAGRLVAVYLLPAQRRRGIASWAVWTLLEEAERDWTLEVPLGLPSAAGFVDAVLADGRRDAVVEASSRPGPTSSLRTSLVTGPVRPEAPDAPFPGFPERASRGDALLTRGTAELLGAMVLLVWGVQDLNASVQRMRDEPLLVYYEIIDGQRYLKEMPPLLAPESHAWTLHLLLLVFLTASAFLARSDEREGRPPRPGLSWRLYLVMALGLLGFDLVQYGGLSEALPRLLPGLGVVCLAAAAWVFSQVLGASRQAATDPPDPTP